MSKSEIVSLRLKNEELMALTALPKTLGKTNSEKMRTLIALAKEKKLAGSESDLHLEESLSKGSVESEVLSFYQLHLKRLENLNENASEAKNLEELELRILKETTSSMLSSTFFSICCNNSSIERHVNSV